jgi:hypothetical protein
MRRRGRNEHGSEMVGGESESCTSTHVWRVRDVTFALPGKYVTEVCERCGELRIAGPDTDGQQGSTWEPDRPWRRDGVHLEDLERRMSASADRPSSKG